MHAFARTHVSKHSITAHRSPNANVATDIATDLTPQACHHHDTHCHHIRADCKTTPLSLLHLAMHALLEAMVTRQNHCTNIVACVLCVWPTLASENPDLRRQWGCL